LRWKPSIDLAVVALSWVLVVGAIYTATNVVGQAVWGGMGYFLLYVLVGATLFGIGIPLYWVVIVRKLPLSELGLTTRHWLTSLILQLVFTLIVNVPRLLKTPMPAFQELFPLVVLALTIGFFEAVFWRGRSNCGSKKPLGSSRQFCWRPRCIAFTISVMGCPAVRWCSCSSSG
jgi:CAAX protease family protein